MVGEGEWVQGKGLRASVLRLVVLGVRERGALSGTNEAYEGQVPDWGRGGGGEKHSGQNQVPRA